MAVEIGFSNNIYDNPADIVASVHLISADFRAIEIELAEEAQPAVFEATPDEYDRIISELRQLATDRELEYAVHAAWYGPHTDLTSPDPDEQRASIALLARSIEFAAGIGAKVVTCHPGFRNGQGEKQLVERLVDSLIQLREFITTDNMILCVENMGAQRPLQTLLGPDSFAEVCARAEVSVCLDIVHLASVFPKTEDLLNAVSTLAPLVRHVHVADMMRPSHRHLPIGRGDLPLEAILHRLTAAGYNGQAIVEEFNPGWNPEQYLAGALAFRERSRSLAIAN